MGIVGAIAPALASIISAVQALWLLLPTVSVSTRRLHDRDLSGWWQMLPLAAALPAIAGAVLEADGLLVLAGSAAALASLGLLVVYALKGTSGPNRFGSDPLDDSGV